MSTATSVLFAFFSTNNSQTLIQMVKVGHESPLATCFASHRAVLGDPKLSTAVLILDETKKELLKTAFASLKSFGKLAKHKDDDEMLGAVKQLQCVLRNAESLTESLSLNELFETLFPLRMWLYVVPRGVFRLLNPDPLILIVSTSCTEVREDVH
nr:hypothetical protein CFP56_08001 [Quercus suber]